MVVTQVWLDVKNGRTTVLDPETARRQQKRWHKKRKPNPTANTANRKRKAESTLTEQTDSIIQRDEGGGETADDENAQLFADAQLQLQQEMAAAGFGDDALPLSFGSAHTSSTGSSRKRQRQQRRQPRESTQQNAVLVPPVAAPTSVEKVHVTFDSDGEIAERVVEAVVVPAVATQDTEPSEVVDPRVEEEGETAVVAERTTQIIDAEEPQHAVDPAVFKFWKQRRTLFHKYDDGIQLDHESWYSVTPESIAQHIAQRCTCDVIVDPFSGCGSNIIQFAQTCRQVIAIEIDADKIRMAKANAAIYGVADRIEWIHGDALQVLPTLRGADVVFLSPPWGGLSYSRTRFSVDEMKIGSTSGVELFEMARRVAKNVVYYLPKTTPEAELQRLTPDEAVECEHIHLNGQLKVVNAYYGDLAFSEYRGQNPRSCDENALQAEDSEGQEPTTTENGDGSGEVLHVTE